MWITKQIHQSVLSFGPICPTSSNFISWTVEKNCACVNEWMYARSYVCPPIIKTANQIPRLCELSQGPGFQVFQPHCRLFIQYQCQNLKLLQMYLRCLSKSNINTKTPILFQIYVNCTASEQVYVCQLISVCQVCNLCELDHFWEICGMWKCDPESRSLREMPFWMFALGTKIAFCFQASGNSFNLCVLGMDGTHDSLSLIGWVMSKDLRCGAERGLRFTGKPFSKPGLGEDCGF